MDESIHQITVLIDDAVHHLSVPHNANLRRVLLQAGFSPYASLTRRLNCGGRGLCATCGVHVESGESAPQHWHDRVGASFGYPRLSCQIIVTAPMTVRILTDKWVWGAPDLSRRWHK